MVQGDNFSMCLFSIYYNITEIHFFFHFPIFHVMSKPKFLL